MTMATKTSNQTVYRLRVRYDQHPDHPNGQFRWQVLPFSRNLEYSVDKHEVGIVGLNRRGDVEFDQQNWKWLRKYRQGLAFPLSCYRHGGQVWSLRGSVADDWDITFLAGVIVWRYGEPDGDYKRRRQLAREHIDNIWNPYVNGEVYWLQLTGNTVLEDISGVYPCDLKDQVEHVAQYLSGDPDSRLVVVGCQAEWLVKKLRDKFPSLQMCSEKCCPTCGKAWD